MNYKKITILFFIFSSIFIEAQNENDVKKATQLTKIFLKQQKIPGLSITVSKNGKNIWSKGFGFANLKAKKKVSPSSTLFRIASISKTLTALALGKLVDENKIKFDDSVYKYLYDFPKKKYDFSISQVAGHTAGIRHYNGKEFLTNKKMSIVKGLDIFKDSKLLFKPGSKFKYSTYGWNLLSVVIQNAAKEDYFKYMNTKVFTPLNMKNTFVENGFNENVTEFYIKRKGRNIIGPEVNNYFKAAGGGFLSTSEDLVLFGNEFISPKVISNKTIQEIITSLKTDDGKKTNYGIGIAVSKTKKETLKLSHSGGGVGASSMLLIYPEEEITIAILTNLSGVKMREYIKSMEELFVK